MLSLPPPARVPELVLLDPPYGTGLAEAALAHLLATGWMGPATWVAVEVGREEALVTEGYDRVVERVIGRAKVVVLRLSS